ncbi:MAG: DUF2911 domain-containing protein [Vicinamibacterales bacterium]
MANLLIARGGVALWLGTALLLAAPPAGLAQEGPTVVFPRTNPSATITQRIGVTDVTVKYNRPSVKGRAVFGALVPYGRVWRTGSDEATTITVDTAFTLNGQPVAAGTYALFTIPGPEAWTVILDRTAAQWGSYSHRDADEVLRVSATPMRLDRPVESLTMGFDDVTAGAAVLHVTWERTRVPVTIGVDVVGLAVPRIEAAMRGTDRKPYFLAAMFYFENGLDLDKAAAWIAAALAESPGHVGMLYRQALILEKKGDLDGARTAARQSLAGAATAADELKAEYTRLNATLLARLDRR